MPLHSSEKEKEKVDVNGEEQMLLSILQLVGGAVSIASEQLINTHGPSREFHPGSRRGGESHSDARCLADGRQRRDHSGIFPRWASPNADHSGSRSHNVAHVERVRAVLCCKCHRFELMLG